MVIVAASERSTPAGRELSSDLIAPCPSPGAGASGLARKPIIDRLFEALEAEHVRYCHWKSNVRLEETLAGREDIDLLVDPKDSARFQAALVKSGFRLAQSHAGGGHPAVFHAIGLDEDSGDLVDLHAYHQIVSGDSFVKNYRFPIEDSLLAMARRLHGVRVPDATAELVIFALRIALKHVNPIETLKANWRRGALSGELAWLLAQADRDRAAALCAQWFPAIKPALFQELLAAIANDHAWPRRVALGCSVAWRLRGLRRLSWPRAAASRFRRLLIHGIGRITRRRDLVLQTGGGIVALVGPKGVGKSTIGRHLSARLGRRLYVWRIHAGKPPATALSVVPRLFAPLGRSLLPHERLAEYQKPERRGERRYSLIHVLRMTLLAYDRRRLLLRALRGATSGVIVVSDRYPSQEVGAIDSSCFDDVALSASRSALRRWLMAKERALYRDTPKPTLVLRLIAPLATAIERDAKRNKDGGPTPEAVRRRWALENAAEFPGAQVVHLDTTAPLDETIRAAVRAVWKAL